MKKILVLCTGNSCRSQMAEAYLHLFLGDGFQVQSAGVEAHGLNPRAVAILLEDGIDIRHKSSKTTEDLGNEAFDLVFTVCDNAQQRCPIYPNTTAMHHYSFEDPAKAKGAEEEVHAVFLRVRNQIKDYCKFLAEKIKNGKAF